MHDWARAANRIREIDSTRVRVQADLARVSEEMNRLQETLDQLRSERRDLLKVARSKI